MSPVLRCTDESCTWNPAVAHYEHAPNGPIYAMVAPHPLDEPAVLLRDTPEDVDDFRGIMVEHGWTHDGMRCGAKCGDAIIAALRKRGGV